MTRIALLVLAACSLFACNQRSDAGLFDPAGVLSVSLTRNDGSISAALTGSDIRTISQSIAHAVYDTLLNDSGIMLRMAEPDYSLVLAHKKADAPDDWAQIWIASGRLLFRSKWYTLRPEELPSVEAVLKKY